MGLGIWEPAFRQAGMEFGLFRVGMAILIIAGTRFLASRLKMRTFTVIFFAIAK